MSFLNATENLSASLSTSVSEDDDKKLGAESLYTFLYILLHTLWNVGPKSRKKPKIVNNLQTLRKRRKRWIKDRPNKNLKK